MGAISAMMGGDRHVLLCWEEGVTGSLNPSPTRKHTSFSFAASACRRRGAHSRKKLVLIRPRGLIGVGKVCGARAFDGIRVCFCQVPSIL